MYLKEGHAGINLTPEKIQLVEIISQDNKFIVANVDEEFFSESVHLDEKETKLSSILQAAFNELVLRNPLASANISFTLPPDYFKIIELPYEKSLIKKDLEEHVRWEFKQLFPYLNIEDVVLQFIQLKRNGFSGGDTMLIAAAIKKHLKYIYKFCARNNFNLKYVDNSHFAANSIVRLNTQLPKDTNGLSIYLMDNILSIIVLQDHHLSFYKEFHYERIDQIFGKINGYLIYLNDYGLEKENISYAVLSGDRASESVKQHIEENLSLNFSLLNPFESLPLEEKLSESDFVASDYYSFAASAGIALRQI